MAMTIVEATRSVTGGVDTHLDVHVAAVLDQVGRLLDTASFPVSSSGYECLFNWLEDFGEIARVGMEGTGAYGAGLARYLQNRGVQVIEVDRPNRAERRRSGKSDTIDAIEAARSAIGGRARSLAKTKDGGVEAIRALLVAKRSARRARTQALIQMRNLVVSSPEELHDRLTGLTIYRLVNACSRLRPDRSFDPVVASTKTALTLLARRTQALEEELERLERLLTELVERVGPDLFERFGVGPDTAAALLVTAGDNPERLRSESAFAHLRGCSDPGVLGQDERAGPTRPRRRPPGQRGVVAHRHGPHRARSSNHRVLRTPRLRGVLEARRHSHLEALRRPRALSLFASRIKTATVGLAHP